MAGKSANNASAEKVRLDKWLWAARFYKTRAIAKQAIDGGKVHCDGVRAKPGKEVTLGQEITLHEGRPPLGEASVMLALHEDDADE